MRAAPEILTPSIADTYRRAMERWDALLEAWYAGPLTLIHGDSHLGNCFEYPAEEGRSVGLLDFQAIHWSSGMRDVQYFLISSLEPEVLQACESDLIGLYCDELSRHGVELSREDAFERYRAFSFQTLLVGVVPLGLANLTEREATVRTITRRSAAAVERLGFREWLESLG
jgi:aminoglycoside phosphotransferase (APT) family kinase protein